ncbi:MAG: PCRF domain-containing protein [Muribaculaceae bacterium]|nr:PCRF domain-containing protein [Muribaculaceae bacterium]
MADNALLQRLEGLDARFEEIGTLITDPAVIADQQRYVKLTKEYKSLETLLLATNKYKKLLSDIDDAKLLLETESDEDLRAMAREEIDNGAPLIPKMEEEIKLLLIPEDPEDSKNVVFEIRGGTGSDEAALFAGDLARMYTRYCETKGWNVQNVRCSITDHTINVFREFSESVILHFMVILLIYCVAVHKSRFETYQKGITVCSR